MEWKERRKWIIGELKRTSQESNSKHENSCDGSDVVGNVLVRQLQYRLHCYSVAVLLNRKLLQTFR
jgi:hypothetical protein